MPALVENGKEVIIVKTMIFNRSFIVYLPVKSATLRWLDFDIITDFDSVQIAKGNIVGDIKDFSFVPS